MAQKDKGFFAAKINVKEIMSPITLHGNTSPFKVLKLVFSHVAAIINLISVQREFLEVGFPSLCTRYVVK